MSSSQNKANSPNEKVGEDRVNRVANFHLCAADVICSDAANSPNLHVDGGNHTTIDGASATSPGATLLDHHNTSQLCKQIIYAEVL